MRVFVKRSGTPNTLISTRSPMPSFTLEFASRRGEEAVVSVAGAVASPVTGVWATRWRLHKLTTNTQVLRDNRRQIHPDIPKPLRLHIDTWVEFNTRGTLRSAPGALLPNLDQSLLSSFMPKPSNRGSGSRPLLPPMSAERACSVRATSCIVHQTTYSSHSCNQGEIQSEVD